MSHGGNVWQGPSPAAWLDFSANIRPGGAPQWVKDALMRAMDDVSYYPDPDMNRAAEGLAEYLGLPRANVLPTAGGISALDLALSLDAPGVMIPTPCFSEYAYLAAGHGKRICAVPMRTDGIRFLPPDAALPEGWILCLSNPNNPSGCALDISVMMALCETAAKAGGYLLADEAFIEYCPQHSVRTLIGRMPGLIIAGSMTKILGIPGVRLGYLCAEERIVRQLSARQLTWEVSAFASAVAEALPANRRDLSDAAARSAADRTRLKAGLEALGARVYASQAPFLLADMGKNAASIAAALRENGILVRECGDFPGVDDGRHLRIAVRDNAANERLLLSFGRAMKSGKDSVCAENH